MIKQVAFLLASLVTTNVSSNNIDKPMPLEHMKIQTLSLLDSSIKDVFSLFGRAEAWTKKDHHDPYYYCYQLNSKFNNTWAILGFGWFTGYEKLTSIEVTSNKKDILGSCAPTNLSPEKASTYGGIHIGLTEKKAAQIIKNKPVRSGNKLTYTYQWYKKYKEPKTFTDSDFVHIGAWLNGVIIYEFLNGILVNYNISVGGEAHSVSKDDLK
jgi:hypothetical protein